MHKPESATHMAEYMVLRQDILLSQKNTHGKNIRIHQRTEYLAERRVVVYRRQSIKLRFWGLLPPTVTESVSKLLPVPEEITTEAQLREFVKGQRGCWRF